MLHLAIKIPDGWIIDDMAKSINNWCTKRGTNAHPSVKEGMPITHPNNVIADVHPVALKERLKNRLSQFPHERWLILSGNTIAETTPHPVFRSA